MNEQQRQTYLQYLGIDSYSPRWVLPGAAPSRALAAPAADLAPVDAAAPEAANEAVAAPESEVAAPVPPLAAPATTSVPLEISVPAPVQDKPDTEAPPAAVAPEPVPHFALTVWRISADLLVVDTRESQLALPTDQLLSNIVAALGYRLAQLPKAEVLRWPLLEAGGAQGETEAREMLQAFLDTQLLRQPAKHLLLMGRDAARYLLDKPLPFDRLLGSAVDMPELSVTAIVVPSLADMLQDPLQKAVAWRAIQPLRQL